MRERSGQAEWDGEGGGEEEGFDWVQFSINFVIRGKLYPRDFFYEEF